MPGVPDVTKFPARVWSRLHNKYWRRLRPDLLTYAPGGGLASLLVLPAGDDAPTRKDDCCEFADRDILIVDDIEFNILTLETMLDELGVKYHSAFNGLEALEAVHRRNVQACVRCDKFY